MVNHRDRLKILNLKPPSRGNCEAVYVLSSVLLTKHINIDHQSGDSKIGIILRISRAASRPFIPGICQDAENEHEVERAGLNIPLVFLPGAEKIDENRHFASKMMKRNAS